MSKTGIIYVISNPAMPDMVKIGKTERDLKERIRELSSSTGVPLAFECVVAKKVKDVDFAETKLHEAFASRRINPKREFFNIEQDELVSLFELLDGEYVSVVPDQIFESKEEKVAFEKQSKLGERFNFSLVGIPIGSILKFKKDENITCEVISNSKVKFRGETHSLSSAGILAIRECGYNWNRIAGPLFWLYEGETCRSIRDKLDED
jgi:hypothetical protein